MPDVPLVATSDFSYRTRRLKAGDDFTAPARDAKVLIAINKAQAPRAPGRVPAPPTATIQRAAAVTPAPKPTTSTSKPRKRRATRKAAAKK